MIEIPHMIMKCKAQRPKLSKFGFVKNNSRLVGFPSHGHFSPKDGQENVKALPALFIISQMK